MKRHKGYKAILSVSLGILLYLLTLNFAVAQSINLKFASWVPQHDTMNYAPNLWMKELEKQTNGKVKVTPFYSESLGKAANSLDMLKTGICDLALMPTGLLSKHFPVMDILSLPGFVTDRVIGTEILYKLLEQGLLTKELSGFKPIVLQAHDPFYVVFNKKKVAKIEEFKGMKIRYGSVTIRAALEALNATPVNIPPAELFHALNSGILDGSTLSPGYLVTSKIYESSKYLLWEPFSCGANIVLMSQKTWDSLPKDVQKIIDELNLKAKDWYIEEGKRQDIDALKTIKAAGLDIYNFSADDQKRFEKLMQPVIAQWITDVPSFPRKEAIEVAKQAIAKHKPQK
jgi:TRAP-type C4-dicarboxylate transport system substrate-binding protein